MNIARKTSLVVMQPTPFCNIDCVYCFVPDRRERTFMSVERVARLFERVFAFPTVRDEITVIWNSGEPLVLGPDYYERAFDAIRRLTPHSLNVRHAMPTNGMLISDRWCEFFKRWNVHVAVSVDGPAELHDKVRITRSGGGTFDKTLAGLRCLKAYDVPFNVLTVLTPSSLEQPDALFAFYKEHGISKVGMNMEEKKGANQRVAFANFDETRVVKFFMRLAELTRAQNFALRVRELELTKIAIRHARDGGTAPNDQVEPFGIITIDVRGNVYTFSPELASPELAIHSKGEFGSFSIGNIFERTFDELAASPNLRRMAEQIDAGTEMCRNTCSYFSVCAGGAPASKLFENGTFASAETVFCRLARQKITDFVLSTIEDMVEVSPAG
jgi:uncharacterized protein